MIAMGTSIHHKWVKVLSFSYKHRKTKHLNALTSEQIAFKYTAIFYGCKNGNFQMKNYKIFLIFAQNIDCGYTLEPPH